MPKLYLAALATLRALAPLSEHYALKSVLTFLLTSVNEPPLSTVRYI